MSRPFVFHGNGEIEASPSDVVDGYVGIHIPGWFEEGMHVAMTPQAAVAFARQVLAAALAAQLKPRPKSATVVVIPQKGITP